MMGKRRPQAASSTHDSTESLRPPGMRPSMIHPSDSELTRPSAVRDGQMAPVTCASCGCRLHPTGEAWFHFNPLGGRDARGCRVACADAAHDTAGRPIGIAV